MFGVFLQELWRLRPSLLRKLAKRQCLLFNRRFGRPCLYHLQRSRRPELKSLPFTGTFSIATLYFTKQKTFRMQLPSETSVVLLNVLWRWKKSWWMCGILVMWHHFQERTCYKVYLLDLLNVEGVTDKLCRNIREKIPIDATQGFRRAKTSSVQCRKPKISHSYKLN
jgi:hypothetical protein